MAVTLQFHHRCTIRSLQHLEWAYNFPPAFAVGKTAGPSRMLQAAQQ